MRGGSRRGLIASVVVAFALVLASGAGAADVLGTGPAHWFGPDSSYGTFNTDDESVALPPVFRLFAVDNLANPGNGEIMPTTNTHVIFWLPAGYQFSNGDNAAYEAQVIKYFQDVGGSQILNTATQYPGNNGTPADTSTFIDSVVDTTAYPHTGADVAHALTQGDINTEVFNQINAHSSTWHKGMSDMYFVFLPDNVVDCDNALSSCNTNKYCAYHTYGFSGSDTPANDFVWADIPDNRSVYSVAAGCGDSNVTGNEAADTTLSSVEHEHLEAVTDPRLNAWQDSTGGGGENGDKCNRGMGVADRTTANNYLGAGNADKFRIQREWSNAVSGCAASYTTTGSGVESPAPTGGDVKLSVAEATIAGNPSDSLTYTLTFTNPSNQDDAFAVTVTNTLPAGVQSGGSSTPTFNLGDVAPHQTLTKTFTAHPTGPLAAGAVLTNSASFAFDDSTGTAQTAIVRTATTTVSNDPPVLGTLPAPQSVDYHDAVSSLGVSATDANAGDTLTFSATGLPAGIVLTDNGNRTATISGTPTAVPGAYVVTVSVDDHHHASPVTGTFTITVTREESTTTYTGPLVILANASGATLSAHFFQDTTETASPTGQSVTLTLGLNTCAATVDGSGNATCVVPVTVALGPEPLSATFAGDTYYLPSGDTSKTAIVFSMPSRGAFALGDATVASAGPATHLTWWSSQWSKLNVLTGGVAASAFKGFADTVRGLPTSTPPSTCSGTFVATGGSSAPPPATVPSYMGVLVSASATKPLDDVTGTWSHIAVVKTDPGYSPSAGKTGTATIVATYC